MSTFRPHASLPTAGPAGEPADHTPATEEPRARQALTTRWSGAGRAFAIVVGTVVVFAALKIAAPVLVPLVAGLFLAVVARPLHRRLRQALPRHFKWLALVVAMLAIIAGVGAFGAALGLSARAVASELRARRPEIEAQAARLRDAANRAGIPVPAALPGAPQASGTRARSSPDATGGSVQGAGSGSGGEPAGGESAGGESGGGESGGSGSSTFVGGAAARVLRTLGTGLAGLGLALAFAALGLAEADEVRRRIAHTGRGTGARRTLDAIDEAAPTFRRYLWVKTLTSAITGIATGLAALAFGLPLAWVWGFLAFLFEYVPTVGSVLAIIPPVLMALAEGGPGKAGAVLLVIGTLQVVLGNVVDPRLEGKLMAVSPFGVLLSIVFWGWLWGAVGALLAVPLTVAVVIACRHIPGARGVATVVAGDGVPDREQPGPA